MSRVLTLFLLLTCLGLQAQQYQLSKPLVKIDGGSFFQKSTTVRCDFRLEGAEIRYTTDGSEPDSFSPVYRKPVKIKNSSTIKVKAFKQGFEPSETVIHQLFKLRASPASVKLSPAPKAPYVAEGGNTLNNQKEGSFNFRDGQWVGYNKGPVTIDIDLGKAMKRRPIVMSTLTSPGSWIMHPESIEARFSQDGEDFTGQVWLGKIQEVKEGDSAEKKYYRIMLTGSYRYVRLTINPLKALPDWHSGKGNAGWVFIDEIFIQ